MGFLQATYKLLDSSINELFALNEYEYTSFRTIACHVL